MRTCKRLLILLVLTVILLSQVASAYALQHAIFPMQVLNISQGMYGNSSHYGKPAIDLAGKDSSIDNLFAPFDARIINIYPNDGHVQFRSIDKVKFADGRVDNMIVAIAHDNYVGNLKVGQTIKQGEVFYQEGNKGISYGNHVHLEVGVGIKYDVVEYTGLDNKGKTRMRNGVPPAAAFFVDTTKTTIRNGAGYNWKTVSNPDNFQIRGTLEDITNNFSASGVTQTEATINLKFYGLHRLQKAGAWFGSDPNNLKFVQETVNANADHVFYGSKKWFGTLQPGTTYYYKFFVDIDGIRYTSGLKNFKTLGSASQTEGNLDTIASYTVKNIGHNDATIYATLNKTYPVTKIGLTLGTNVSNFKEVEENVSTSIDTAFYNAIKWFGELQPETTYFYRFFFDISGVRYYSSFKDFSTLSKPAGPTPEPITLTKPVISSIKRSGSSISLAWSAASGAASYKLYRSINDGNFVNLTELGNVTSYQDNSVKPGNKYAYKLMAIAQNPDRTATSDAKALTYPLTAPVIQTAQRSGNNISLSWTAVPGAVSYKVYRSVNGGNYVNISSLGMVTTYQDTGVVAANKYSYLVRAYGANATIFSASAAKAANDPVLPTTPVFVSAGVDRNRATITWKTVPGAVSYRIYRSVNGGNHVALTDVGKVTSYTNTGLQAGTNYSYKLVAIDAAGLRSLTSQAKAISTLKKPTINTLSVDGTTANLSWDAVPGATAYMVYRTSGTKQTYLASVSGTSTKLTGLNPGETYAYSIVALRGQDKSILSAPISARCLPAPTIGRLTFNTTTIQLTWGAVSGATSYQVYRSVNGGAFQLYQNTSGTAITDSRLAIGSTYRYQLVSKGANSTSAPTSARGVKLFETPVITAISGGTTSASLRWGAIEGANQYVVYRSINGEPFVWHAVTDQLNFQDSNLQRGANYRYSIRARISYGLSDFSAPRSIRTPIVLTTPVISSINNSGNNISLQWAAQTGVNQYVVYRSVNGGAYTAYKTLGFVNYFTDSNQEMGKTYYYRIKSFTDGASSVLSDPASITLLSTPVLSPVTANGTTANVRWGVVPGTYRYQVYRSQGGGAAQLVATVADTAFDDKDLTAGAYYTYTVVATNGNWKSKSSAARGITPLVSPGAPTVNASGLAASISWNAVRLANNYQVYRSVNGSGWNLVATVSSTNYQDSGLANGSTYAYRVKAQNAEALSVLSGAQSVSISVKLAQPSLTGASASGNTASVSWGAVSGASQYQVYRSVNGSGWELLATVSGISYSDAGLQMGSNYSYRVKAFGSGTSSDLSGSLTVTALQAPATPVGTVSGNSISITWEAIPGASEYEVIYSKDNGPYAVLRRVSSPTCTVGNLASGSKYSFAIRSVSGSSVSGNSGVRHLIIP